jgi:predicted 3-demethylubiquinone-9 3-methyltransferase (glyoxalase superfamily)
MNKVTPFLMFDGQLEAAIEFYTATFPDSEVRSAARSGSDGPINAAEFVIAGQRFMAFNGGARFMEAGATPSRCGWMMDPFGVSWQIVPRRFVELIRDENPAKVKAVMEAMMGMVKLEVAGLEKAWKEA